MNQILRRAALIAATAAVVVGCSSSTELAARPGETAPSAPATSTLTTPRAAVMAAYNEVAPIQDVPWSEVGPGWMLAMWNAATPTNPGDEFEPGDPTPYNSETTLYLVNPVGGRYAITTFEAPGESGSLPTLVDWSGDGTRALFSRTGDDLTVMQVDLRTGERTSFRVEDGFAVTPRYSLPEGKAVLLLESRTTEGPAALTRVDLSGKQQLTYPVDKLGNFNESFLSTPDGTELVLGTDRGLTRMGNDGTPGKELPVPDASYCTPLRWWDADLALTRCNGPDFSYSRLWLVPLDGTAPTPLTAKNDGSQGPDLADLNAWHVPEGTFVQAAGGCGFVYLAKLNAEGTTTPVSVPEVDDNHSVRVLGVNDGNLQLQATLSCGSGETLVDYDPEAGTSTVLLGGDANGGGVVDALAYPARP